LLEKHDKSQVEVYAYANPPFEDETTEYYKKSVDHWIYTREMTDAELAERIRADGIDVLIDVAGTPTVTDWVSLRANLRRFRCIGWNTATPRV
jgi:predicted O-linked N-acetylglucosamine transferase (SPINDLY family)